MSPELEVYYSKVARFRNIDALYTEESFYLATKHRTVMEVREEMKLHDGYWVSGKTPTATESNEDYSWYYKSGNVFVQSLNPMEED
jgi:hypothetical protein